MKHITILALIFMITTSFVKKIDKSIVQNNKEKILFVFFDNTNSDLQLKLASETAKFYNYNFEINNKILLPGSSYYKPRNRYRAEKLLTYLSTVPGKYAKIIGFTSKDISTTKDNIFDYGIFGLGACPGKTCVVSGFRLHSNYNYCLNVLIHEVGHTLGLPHCLNKECVMNAGDGTINSLNMKIVLCSSCKNKISLR